MRSAPPVEVQGRVPSAWGFVASSAAGFTGALMAAWLAGHAELSTLATALLVPGSAALTVLAMRALAACRQGRGAAGVTTGGLAWDGERWTCRGDEVVPEVALDFGTMALLRLRLPQRRTARWLWVDGRRSPRAWHALRSTLWMAPRPDAGRPGATP